MSDIKEIFIVEDDTIVALDMADLLERLGFEVVGPAVHQEQAIEIARTDKFDAAFLDVNLG
ncbi:response regulator [Sphingomonas kaistensis]|uniref:Response regulator n=1 Tax=Sphingomonas kaistensis TaxID=298708 RepID=A0ABZ2G250_9SPHN